MSDGSFSLCFRARHPSSSPPDVQAHLSLPLEIHWKAGDQKRTPKGQALEGLRRESYWVFGMSPSEDDLSASVQGLLTELASERDFFDKFISSGGYLEVYVTYGPDTPGELVLPDLMKQLADRNVALGIDWVRS